MGQCEEVTQLKQRVAELDQKVTEHKRKVNNLQKWNNVLLREKQNTAEGLQTVFTEDQIRALGRKSNCGSPWSSATIKKSLQLHFACGSTGYNLLLSQGQPLPAERTLRSHIQGIKFEPGVLCEVFDLMKCKVAALKPQERKCVLMLDEMQLQDKLEYDASNQSICGSTTLGNGEVESRAPKRSTLSETQAASCAQTSAPTNQAPCAKKPALVLANHCLVFMIGGVSTRWKQVVAYHFTGASFSGSECANIFKEIVRRCSEIGLDVIAVTSDMGAGNRAMWKDLNIIAGKHSRVSCSTPHPENPSKVIHFLADVPHIIKNLRNHLCRLQKIVLPQDVVDKHNLPSDVVHLWPVKELMSHERGKAFKLAPHLTDTHLSQGHFDKMKVCYAVDLMSHKTACAIEELVKENVISSQALSTAWFFKTVNKWFDLMCSRHPGMAFSLAKPEKHDEAVAFLEFFMDMFQRVKIGDGVWKPVQTGVLLSTSSILALQKTLLHEDKYTFVLTSRFTQDSLENLFSVVRGKNPIPTPYQCKVALRIISVSQYLKAPAHSSYSIDDGAFFLADYRSSVPQEVQEMVAGTGKADPDEDLVMPSTEESAFVYMSGYLAASVLKNNVTCSDCRSATVDPGNNDKAVGFTLSKCFKEGALTVPSKKLVSLYHVCETVFRRNEDVLHEPRGCTDKLVEKIAKAATAIHFPDCHPIKRHLIRRFVVMRIRIFLKELSRCQRQNQKQALEARKFASASTARK